jgi:hypothetical protein
LLPTGFGIARVVTFSRHLDDIPGNQDKRVGQTFTMNGRKRQVFEACGVSNFDAECPWQSLIWALIADLTRNA